MQDVLADGKVAPLHLALRALDGVGEHGVLNRGVLADVEPSHQRGNAVAAEQAHEVVVQRDIEAALARVALTAGTTAQLVVDAAGLVALGADDIQPACLADFLRLLLALLVVFLHQLAVLLAHPEDFGVLGLLVADGGVNHILVNPKAAQLALCLEFAVAAQLNVGTASRHVRGDGDRALVSCLRDNFRLFFVVLRVEHLVLDAALAQQLAQFLGLADVDGSVLYTTSEWSIRASGRLVGISTTSSL